MATLAQQIKQLHAETGAGYMQAKRALEAAGGDTEAARLTLLEAGGAAARGKAHRVTREGRIEIYRHPGDRIGVMLELHCETDFAAATLAFRALSHRLALHIAAMDPAYTAAADIPADTLARETALYEAQARLLEKPGAELPAIVQGKLQRFRSEHCLLEQPFVMDPSLTVGQLITQTVAVLRENITVARFVRYQLERV